MGVGRSAPMDSHVKLGMSNNHHAQRCKWLMAYGKAILTLQVYESVNLKAGTLVIRIIQQNNIIFILFMGEKIPNMCFIKHHEQNEHSIFWNKVCFLS